MSPFYGYRRWDGTQDFGDLDPDALLAELTDDLLSGGDLGDALHRIMRSGMEGKDGQRILGAREMSERLRKRRAELEEAGDPGAQMGAIKEKLDAIEAEEREGIDDLEREAKESKDERRVEVTNGVVAERRLALDLLEDDVAGRIQSMQHYEFISSTAREQFEELLDELRKEIADTFVKGASKALGEMDDEQRAHLRDAFNALNTMLEQRERGEDLNPSFEDFMASYGDLFPNANSLDELLEQLAQRMAAAEAVWRSLSPEQRQEIQALSDALLEDMDLRWQVDRLSTNLKRAVPNAGWDSPRRFSGDAPMSMPEAADLASQMAELDRMEDMLQSASSPAALSEIDLTQVKQHLGEDASRSLEELARLTKKLSDEGLVDNHGGRLELTPKGVRRLGQRALADLFSSMKLDRIGGHRDTTSGTGHDREETTKPYEYGDPFNLALSQTVHNALRRSGSGIPVSLDPQDFEIIETEALTRSATVLLVDLSMSMPMRDNFVPAKKMAMALHTLISSRFPRDYIGIVGFSEVAHEIYPEQLPTAMWDYVYGTNLQHALMLGRKMLAHQHGFKQIIVVTDGEPTAHIDAYGEPIFNYPPVPETLRRTMAEVIQCTRAKVTINVFALDLERTRFPFVEQISKVNGGRTFYVSNDALGSYVLVDFLRHRRFLRHAS